MTDLAQPTSDHVHIYRETREVRLLRLVHVLWTNLNYHQQALIGPGIVKDGMGWALPGVILDTHTDDDWVTVDEIAFEFGITESAVRNWQQRYGLRPVKGRYRWGDVKAVRNRQNAS